MQAPVPRASAIAGPNSSAYQKLRTDWQRLLVSRYMGVAASASLQEVHRVGRLPEHALQR
jgi:hypothetical protein